MNGRGRSDWLGVWDSYNRARFDAYKREISAALRPYPEARQAVIDALEREMPHNPLAEELIRSLRQLDETFYK